MQEIQIFLVQAQTVAAQLAFQVASALGVALAWLALALGRGAYAWRGLCALVARVAVALGILWLTVLAVAWPPLLERAGNVLGPFVAGLVAIMLVTEVLEQFLRASSRHGTRMVAGAFMAVGFTAALVLVLAALAWLREPMGVALIDGRYQITEWADIVASPWLSQSILATVFAALLLLAALAQWACGSARTTVLALPDAWLRVLVGLGVAGLLGMLWLLARAVGGQLNPATQSTQTLYEALLSGTAAWSLRVTFVLWLVTLAGFTVSLGSLATASQLGQRIKQLPAYTAPVLWLLVCWHLFGLDVQSTAAGFPLADLASMQPPAALAFGLVLVAGVIVSAIWLVRRFLVRLTELAHDQDSGIRQGGAT